MGKEVKFIQREMHRNGPPIVFKGIRVQMYKCVSFLCGSDNKQHIHYMKDLKALTGVVIRVIIELSFKITTFSLISTH